MTLLSDAIEASGGVTRWDRFKRFTLQLSIDGALLSDAGHGGRFKNVVAEGSTQRQFVRFTGFADPGKSCSYEPERVTIEDAEGRILETRRDPRVAFQDKTMGAQWDELTEVYFCGLSIWNCLATPFLLAQPDVKVEELRPWRERDQEWRRLHAAFPPRLVTPSPEQTFYFDSTGLQRRTDHQLLGAMVAQYSWAHQAFGDLVIPTLRRSLTLNGDGTVLMKPALLDVEIFDATFE
jgi:hypothetical protein